MSQGSWWRISSVLLMTVSAFGADKQRVYVSVGNENRLAIYDLDASVPRLTPAGSVSVEGGPGSIAVSPNHDRLYVAVRNVKGVASLAIDPVTGNLTLLDTTKVIDNPVFLWVDASQRHVLLASYGGDKVAVYPLSADGKVAPEATCVLETGRNPHSLRLDRTGKFAYAPNCGSDVINQYRYEAGKLTPLTPDRAPAEAGAGPRHQTWHPKLDVYYCVNEKNSSVTGYRHDPASGQLTALQTLPTIPKEFTGKNTCADIEITPDGKFLYCSNRGHDSLAGYRVDASTGQLTLIDQFPTEATPREFAIDATGQCVIAAGQGSGKLAIYRLDAQTGRLERKETLEVGKSPAWVTILKLAGS